MLACLVAVCITRHFDAAHVRVLRHAKYDCDVLFGMQALMQEATCMTCLMLVPVLKKK